MSPAEEQLHAVVDAWEALPGGRQVRNSDVEEWLAKDMSPAINAIRGFLQRPKPDGTLPSGDADEQAAINLGAAVLARIKDPAARETAIRNAMTLVRDHEATVRAALATQPASTALVEWQPIDTAPRDGSPVLIWVDGHVIKASFDSEAHEWVAGVWGLGFDEDASYWRHLPSPPDQHAFPIHEEGLSRHD